MRRALSLLAATVIMLVGAHASALDGGTDGGPDLDASSSDGASGDGAAAADASATGKDSGIGTTPSPNNPTVTPDSGAGDNSASSSGGDSGGCALVSSSAPPGRWPLALGLFTAASILVLSRRRRAKR